MDINHPLSSTDTSQIGMVCQLSKQAFEYAVLLSEADSTGTISLAMLSNESLGEQSILIELADDLAVLGRRVYIHLHRQVSLDIADLKLTSIRLSSSQIESLLRQDILSRVDVYAAVKYSANEFLADQHSVPVSGKVLASPELQHLVDASLDGWLTTGRFNDLFEQRLADYLGIKHVLTTNSGSSANLLALTALTSPKLGDRALKPGDEVITVAAGFPTTVNPILQNNLVPVFVDISLPTYNIDVSKLAAALTDKTKAIMLAHTLGNTFNIDEVVSFARANNLWIVEDCCDALGSTYSPSKPLTDYRGKQFTVGEAKHVGSFGDVASLSFYPAHHITMGEGGAVFTNNGKLKIILESFRDWGRDCFCPPGQDNTCKKRFCQKLGDLPEGYDHKYTYSHVGYNLKITDMQAAVALAQMDRLDQFVASRKRHFAMLYDGLSELTDFIVLPEPEQQADVSWFGFAITLKQHSRNAFIAHLEQHKIASRLIFGGNLTKQPYFKDQNYRVIGDLSQTDLVMNNSLWIGVFPGISDAMVEHMITTVKTFFGEQLTVSNPLYNKLFVLEMANNHQGSIQHGKRVIAEMKQVCDDFPFQFAFKLQYRNLQTFIHPDYRDRQDIKYVKRFRDTELNESQLLELKTAIDAAGFISMCTPFDEESVSWIEKHGFKMLKIASCSLTDWPLLERIAQSPLPLVASTAGATQDEITKVVQFFKHRNKQLAIMHCVGEYPTPRQNLQLGQIALLKNLFPALPVGYSTHEQPDETEAVKMAIALGAQLFEKHVGVGELNGYSANPEQVRNWLLSAQQGFEMLGLTAQRVPVTEQEVTTLNSLRRALFAKKPLSKGQRLSPEDFFLAIPSQTDQVLANDLSKYVEFTLTEDVAENQPILFALTEQVDIRPIVEANVKQVCALLRDAKVAITDGVNCQLSHHYGIDQFAETGATIIELINREYCKKVIVMLAGQNHPTHYHQQKEESFNILSGEMSLILNGKAQTLHSGDMVTVARGVKHSFSTETGVIFEEISTTDQVGDSFYDDDSITQNKYRKTPLIFRADWLKAEW